MKFFAHTNFEKLEGTLIKTVSIWPERIEW